MLFFIRESKSISPLIAIILLVVVAVVLIGLVLGWGKSFTTSSLSNTNDLSSFKPSDVGFFLDIEKGLNGRFLAYYRPPPGYTQSITISYYSLLGLNRIPLEPSVTISSGSTKALDLGIVDNTFDLVLYLDDNTTITKTSMQTENRSPSSVDCPTGYVPVPGNFLYDTTYGNRMGFCVAKYEMKVDMNDDGIGDVNISCDYNGTNSPNYQVWYSMQSEDCNVSNGTIVSTPEGYPITGIAQNTGSYYDSKNACESLGSNYHLITNDEWMTIARNIERVNNNWSAGEIGSGYLPRGNSSSSAAMSNSTELSGITKRTLTLSNGETIWDLSGNVWEWTDQNIQRKDMPDGVYDSNGDSYIGWNYFEYADGATYDRYLSDRDSLDYKDIFLIDNTYNTDQGIGRIRTYSDPDDTSTTVYGFLRGGSWNYGTYAGPLALSLPSSPSLRYPSVGFRCAVVP